MEYNLEIWFTNSHDEKDFILFKVNADSENEAIELAKKEVRSPRSIFYNGKKIY